MQPAFHFMVRLCLRAATASPLWSVDIGIYVQFYLCPILFYLKKKNKKTLLKNQGSPWCSPQVIDIWLLVPIAYGKSFTVWVVPGVGLFLDLFLVLILRCYILYQLLIHHFEGEEMLHCCS